MTFAAGKPGWGGGVCFKFQGNLQRYAAHSEHKSNLRNQMWREMRKHVHTIEM